MRGKVGPDLEAVFLLGIRAYGMRVPKREYIFHHTRKWRFDFAYPEFKIAIEIEGGTSLGQGGGHTSILGFRKDCKKYNEAGLLGWIVLRGDSKMVRDGSLLEVVKEALKKLER